jgi:hypothetical protein
MSITSKEIDDMRNRIIANLADLELKKYSIRSGDHLRLVNLHSSILGTLDEMKNMYIIESSNPYVRPAGATAKTVNVSGEGWEDQFSPSLLLNPPCYVRPPQGVTNLELIRNSGEANRLSRL